jgi:predicted alpha/beta-hydrolase family hydrolase
MPAEPEPFSVKIDERESVTALLYPAALAFNGRRAGITLLLGHGAGANQLSPFMRLFASGLAARGFDAMTFNFLYTERGRRLPDPKATLESCYRAVIDAAINHKKLEGNRLVIGGKSMGGRIASQVATAGADDISALVFLGYPLHPPGKPDKLRAEHLQQIRAPMLFVQGSRDAFGTPDELRAVIRNLHLPATLYVIEGGDHSFKVLKSLPMSQQQVYESAMDQTARWVVV